MYPSNRPPGNYRLRQERKARNWRQQDLAERLGTTAVSVKRWEAGTRQPSAYFRVKLCALFGKSAEELGLLESDLSSSAGREEEGSNRGAVHSSPREGVGIWMVPYRRNPHFTGREDLLDQLAQHLALEHPEPMTTTRQAVLSQPQAIKGLGGIGKTQIALEYAYRAREQGRYTHTFWINAGSSEAILASFQALAAQLPGFAAKDEQNQHKLIAAIGCWLEQCPHPWLLIVDNADDLALVQPCLPVQGPGSILLTTRAHAVAALGTPLEVELMGLAEGTHLLLHRSQRLQASDEERNEASNIVIALDGFPLALDQAGAYLEEIGCSFGDYRKLYEQHRARLLARRGRQTTHYPESVATTWDLSFQQVEQTHPAAAELLRLCAYLSPDHIPEELLTEAAALWPPVLQEAVADRFTFNELIESLLAFSLVKRLAQEHLLSVHRLVQAVQRERMEEQVQQAWAQRVVRAVHLLFPADPKDEVNTWPLCLRYLEQVQACVHLIQQHHLRLAEAAELLDRAGRYLREHASYSLAEQLFGQALHMQEQMQGPDHPQVAALLNNLGTVYDLQGKYEQAEVLLQRALQIWEQALGPDHLEVARALSNLGILCIDQGKYEQAEVLLQRALRNREQTQGPDHLEVAFPLHGLGLLYREQGKYEQAEPLFQRALHIREQALGPDHPQVALSLNSLGLLYREQGQYEQGEVLFQRALQIREQTLGPDHPLIAPLLNNLGLLCIDQGKYEQGEVLFQRALQIREQTLGPDHLEVAHPLNNLGLLYIGQGKYEQAEPLFQRALQIWEQALGSHHPLVARPLAGLANLSLKRGRYDRAEILYQRVLSLRQEQLGQEHPEVAETLQDLAQLRDLQQHPGEALSLYQKALVIRERMLGAHHPKTGETRERLQGVLDASGRWRKRRRNEQ